jgi:hypothetical protein
MWNIRVQGAWSTTAAADVDAPLSHSVLGSELSSLDFQRRHANIGRPRERASKHMELHLVADTNLFFECKALDQLPWLELGADPIVILLTKPVLDEIDKHKKGNGRTRDRALAIYGRVRDMLRSSAKEVEIQASFPRVLLRRETTAKPDPAFAEDLNYTKTDEILIGIASALNQAASGTEVKLFTIDTGPAATADALGVPYLLIDEGWRRPPAETTEQKKIKDLEKDLATYRAQEPSIAIVCEGTDSPGFVVVTNRKATPLAEAEVEAFVERLRLKHPLEIDFTPPEPKNVSTRGGGTTKPKYAPPESDAIAKYRDGDYPVWIERCRRTLRTLHVGRDQIERSVKLRWSMSNEGTRPGSRVRVEFEAKGSLELKRIREPDDEHNTAQGEPPSAQPPAASLPLPPKRPAFQINTTHLPPREPGAATPDFDALRREIERATASLPLAELAQQAAFDAKLRAQLSGMIDPGKWAYDPIVTQVGLAGRSPFEFLKEQELARLNRTESWAFVPPQTPNLSSLLSRGQRDPEEFHYDWPDDELVKKGALTCELWRHRSDPEIFDFEVVFIGDGEARGLVECTVHAENLTRPVREIVKVARTIGSVGMAALANSLIETCG